MSKIPACVELYYSGAWHDITATDDVYARDPIRVARGRPNWLSSMPPSRCDLSIENRDAKYSLRNPMSVLWGLIGRNTPLRVSVKRAQDTFTRTLADDWGTSSFGQAYIEAGDTFAATDYDVNGAQGTIQPSTVAVRRFATVDASTVDFDIEVEIAVGSTPATGTVSQGVVGRFTDTNHHYLARVQISTTSTVTLLIDRRFTGITTNIGSVLTSLTHVNGAYKTLRFRGDGTSLWAKVWNTGSAEPAGWTLSITDTVITTGTRVGMYAINDTAVTTHVFSYDNFIERDIRFTGEVESWPQRWNVKGNDVWAPITAWGIRRRLNAPGTTAPSVSALRRAFTKGILSSGLIAYYPFEDLASATTGVSALAATPAVTFTTAVIPGAVLEPQAGSLPYATADNRNEVSGIYVSAFSPVALPASTAGFTAFTATIKGTMPRPTAARAVIYHVTQVGFSGGNITDFKVTAYAKWTGTAFSAGDTGLDVLVGGGTSFGSVLSGNSINLFDGNPHDIHVRLDQSGADILGQLWVDGVMVASATSAGKTLGVPVSMPGPTSATGTLGGTAADNNDTTLGFGHYAVHAGANPGVTATDVHVAAAAHIGELAANRITRLCTEDGIAAYIVGTAATTEAVGVQRAAPFLELLQDAADADGGPLYEPRELLGFAYRTHRSHYNQTPAVTLDYSAGGEVAPPLEPLDDTDTVVNDATVTRYLGASSQLIQETGTLNVQEPGDDPDGVGRYEKDFTLVLATDAQTYQHAAWRRHVGTWDEARYTVLMDLAAMEVAGKTALIQQAANLDIGDRLAITDLPVWITPDGTEQHAQGFVETIETHLRSIAVNTTPAGPFNVATLDSTTLGRLDNDACTLNEALDTTEVGVDVLSVNTPWGSAFPYDINIGGERMTVTGRSGAALAQTLTVTRSVNGVVKTHATGIPVRLWNPMRLAR